MTEDTRTQSTHISDRRGNPLVSVFVFADDTFQVVDERGSNRRVVLDTHIGPRVSVRTPAPKVTQEALPLG